MDVVPVNQGFPVGFNSERDCPTLVNANEIFKLIFGTEIASHGLAPLETEFISSCVFCMMYPCKPDCVYKPSAATIPASAKCQHG